jgi:hypothetical protein
MQKYSVLPKDLLPQPSQLPPYAEVGVYLVSEVDAEIAALKNTIKGLEHLINNDADAKEVIRLREALEYVLTNKDILDMIPLHIRSKITIAGG